MDAKDGYLIEIDAYAESEKVHFYSAKGIPVTVKYPDDSKISTEQRNFIKSYFGKMEASTSDYSKYLDIDSFLRNFIVGEFCGNTDTYWSVFMYKERDDDLMYTGPVWDFDLAFDNDQRVYPVSDKSDFLYRSGGSCAGNMRSFVDKIVILNAAAKAQMLDIWDEARQSGLTEENMIAYIDRLETDLLQSQRLNFLRWPIMNQRVHQNPPTKGSFQAEVEVLRTYMKERFAWYRAKQTLPTRRQKAAW